MELKQYMIDMYVILIKSGVRKIDTILPAYVEAVVAQLEKDNQITTEGTV